MRPADPSTDAERRACVRQIYEGLGWECGRIMTVMSDAPDVYFDAVSQIRMSHWSRGRAALVGDAAACVSLLAGEGTGLAMAEAYVLAAELIARPRNHAAAFAAYEQRMMPFLARKQRAAAKFASSFAPRTAHGLAFRNLVTRLARVPVLAEWLLARDLFDKVELPTMP
jgi:2-polyprenyl-6-methoxyphenol hydroxylase-like FAD-dependent oxidoreductase